MFSFLAVNNHNEVNQGKEKKSDHGKERKHHPSPKKKKPSPKRKLKYQSESDAETESASEQESGAESESESSNEREATPKRHPKPQAKPASAEKKDEPKVEAIDRSSMDLTADAKKNGNAAGALVAQQQPAPASGLNAANASAAQQTAPVFGGGNTFFSNPFPVATAPLERPVGNRRFFRDFQEGLIDGCPARQETIRCVTRETFQGYVTVSVQEKTTLQIRNPHTGFLLFNRTTVNEHSETEQQEVQAVGNYFNPFGGTY